MPRKKTARRKRGGAEWGFHNWQTEIEKHLPPIEALMPTLTQLRSSAGVGSDVKDQLREQLSPHVAKLAELLDEAPMDDRRTRAVATRARGILTRAYAAAQLLGARRRKTRRKRSRLN